MTVTADTATTTVTVSAAELRRALSATLPAASKNTSPPVLNAVHLRLTRDELVVSATDRYVIAEYRLDASADGSTDADVLLATDTVAALVKTLPSRGNEGLLIRLGDREVTFDRADGGMTARTVDGDYPNLPNLLAEAGQADDDVPPTVGLTVHVLGVLLKCAKVVDKSAILRVKRTHRPSDGVLPARERPAAVTVQGYNKWRAVVMPARLTD